MYALLDATIHPLRTLELKNIVRTMSRLQMKKSADGLNLTVDMFYFGTVKLKEIT